MTHFFKSGNTYSIASDEALEVCKTLPPGNYTIKKRPMSEDLYLEHIGDFTVPSKIYGDTVKNADRIINTFFDRENSTGVLLTGEKGSGKTLLSKTISARLAQEHGVPTIVINEDWHGDNFNTLIQTISQPCVVLFDEFEKVYDKEEQEAILTLLDGVFPTKKLFMFTVNDKWRIDRHMQNRPGRIFYLLDFKGLAPEFIREYCRENLHETGHIERICQIASLFKEFNFDMLKALVEEMNRYGETPSEAFKMLNASPEYDEEATYAIRAVYKGKLLDPDKDDCTSEFRGNPLTSSRGVYVSFDYKPEGKSEDDSKWMSVTVTSDNLVSFKDGRFHFKKDDMEVVLTRRKQEFNFNAF